MTSTLTLAGFTVRSVNLLDHRVTARFIEEGSGLTERRWLEICAPADAYPGSLHCRLEDSGLSVPCTAIIAVEPANEPDSLRWTWLVSNPEDQIVVPYCPTDTAGAPLPFPKSRISEVRRVLRYVGIGKAPVVRRTWRDLV